MSKLEDFIGDEVVITLTHEGYDGKMHRRGTIAHVYRGFTYGCVADNEEALIFGKKYSFVATPICCFEKVNKNASN